MKLLGPTGFDNGFNGNVSMLSLGT